MADLCHIWSIGNAFPKQMRYQAAPLPDADFRRFLRSRRQPMRNTAATSGTLRHTGSHILRHSPTLPSRGIA